jgi:hypothetical protein
MTEPTLVERLYAADGHATTGPHAECHRLFFLAAREIERLAGMLDTAHKFHAVAVKERDHERAMNERLTRERDYIAELAGTLADTVEALQHD